MVKSNVFKLLIVNVAAATCATIASAQSVPDASYSVAAYSVGPADIIHTAGSVSSSGVDPYGFSSSTASASGAQSVSTSGTSSGVYGPAGGTPQAIGDSIARYYFKIIGPSSVSIRLLISGSGNLSASGDGEAFAAYARYQGDAGGVEYQNQCTAGLKTCGGFTYSDAFTLLASDGTTVGTVGSVQLRADIEAGNGSASATIDPLFTIDPSFADAGLYRIVFSDGVINGGVSSAPEPATWAMLIVGFGLAGAVMRSRPRIARKIASRAAFTR